MQPKRNRVNKKEVDLIFTQGKFVVSPSFTFKFIKTSESFAISFIAPKSVVKLAVKRNSLRRKGYNALKKCGPLPQNLLGVFIYKKYLDDVAIIEHEIKSIFSKIH